MIFDLHHESVCSACCVVLLQIKIMATDLHKTWFQSILKADIRQLTRLLYCTPNPDIGRKRLEWTVSTADPYLADLLPNEALRKFQEKFRVEFQELDGITIAILMLAQPDIKEGLEVSRLLCGVSCIRCIL